MFIKRYRHNKREGGRSIYICLKMFSPKKYFVQKNKNKILAGIVGTTSITYNGNNNFKVKINNTGKCQIN